MTLANYVKGTTVLIRIIPVLTWGISASIVGLGFAINQTSFNSVNWLHFILFILEVVLIHGVFSHALNDEIDWLSGTDKTTIGILSGGSGVVRNDILKLQEVKRVKWISFGASFSIALYLTYKTDIITFIYYMLALWSAFGYTNRILSLSYKPFLGEWLCGWTGVYISCTGTYYILTGTHSYYASAAAALHGIFAVVLLMFHHIPDIEADYNAVPKKITTPVFFYIRLGKWGGAIPAILYSMLALLVSAVLIIFIGSLFWISVIAAVFCLLAAVISVNKDIYTHAKLEKAIYTVLITDACCKFIALSIRGTAL